MSDSQQKENLMLLAYDIGEIMSCLPHLAQKKKKKKKKKKKLNSYHAQNDGT